MIMSLLIALMSQYVTNDLICHIVLYRFLRILTLSDGQAPELDDGSNAEVEDGDAFFEETAEEKRIRMAKDVLKTMEKELHEDDESDEADDPTMRKDQLAAKLKADAVRLHYLNQHDMIVF